MREEEGEQTGRLRIASFFNQLPAEWQPVGLKAPYVRSAATIRSRKATKSN